MIVLNILWCGHFSQERARDATYSLYTFGYTWLCPHGQSEKCINSFLSGLERPQTIPGATLLCNNEKANFSLFLSRSFAFWLPITHSRLFFSTVGIYVLNGHPGTPFCPSSEVSFKRFWIGGRRPPSCPLIWRVVCGTQGKREWKSRDRSVVGRGRAASFSDFLILALIGWLRPESLLSDW